MKSESTQDGLRAALNRYDGAYRGGRIDMEFAAIALAEEVRAALAAQPGPPAEDTEYGFDRTKEHSEHFGAPPTENTVEAARREVREAIARFPGAVPVSALAKAEAAIRADERSKAQAEAPTRAENAQVGPAIRAAFDGAPAAPSEAVVERVAKAIWQEYWNASGLKEPDYWNETSWKGIARAAIAALSEEAIDA